MPWIIIAATATTSSVFILTLVNIYLYFSYRERFMKIWAYAWGVHTFRYLFLIGSELWPSSRIIKEINYLFIIASAIILLTGTRVFIGRPTGRKENLIGVLIAIWTIYSISSSMPIMTAMIPIFAFLSYTYIHIGIQLLKNIESKGVASRITGWLFILWGIHQADYPFLRPIEWFAPWGFLIGGVLATTIALGMVLIYFERTHLALRAKEDRYEQLIESSHNWIWEVNAEAVYTFASAHVKGLLGYTPEEVLGRTPFDLMPEEEATHIREIFGAIAARREPFHRLENTNQHKDGRLVVLETSGVPFYDGNGGFCGYRGMDQDITEHKQAEIRRDVSKQVLQALNETHDLKVSLEQVINLLKTDMNYDAVGIRLQEGEDYPYLVESGLPKDLLIKENSLIEHNPEGGICRHEDGSVCLVCTCGLVITGRVPLDNPLFTPGGSFWTNDSSCLLHLSVDQEPRHNPRNECIHHKYASFALVPIRYKDKIVGLIQCNDHRKNRFTMESIQHLEGIAAYIGSALMRKWYEDERINLEKQLHQAQRMESVGRLAGGVAHDFNNMLGVIIGHTSLGLMETDSSQPIYNHLQEINSAAERSADLTRQLLAFARKQTIEPKVLNVNDAITDMLKMLQRLIGEDIQLNYKPGAQVWPVMMDPSQVDQIMANLCVNARDAIHGVGTIVIETGTIVVDDAYRINHSEAGPGEYVWITVSDNGCGMDKDTSAHIFEPFFTTKAPGEGTGLGLSTIYGIVKQNNGFINVYSEPEQGTTFTICIPRHIGAQALPPQKDAAMLLPSGDETILLVEDEPAILAMTTALLMNQGYNVLPVCSPIEAIQVAHQHKNGIDLLMTDVIMPKMNGKDLAQNLKMMYPNLRCLFMSGYTADIIAQHGVLDKGIDFIQKPFPLPTLAVKVREVLDLETHESPLFS
ncbi:PAS domain S-box protein [Oryzomonas rubra]|uniref:histidine kinase n=1 Tax=Oryzomonas rubra TaxID=2509454 RepID=A0A5A9X8L0_9BACT|nr:PAS domain S-box protein [Oryzomonas rubra]KAA0887961.1 PAS domain S-box protein [Oryzomonas rubra]